MPSLGVPRHAQYDRAVVDRHRLVSEIFAEHFAVGRVHFAWPGMGLRILEAIQDGQAVLVVSIALVIGLLIQLIGLLLDISYRFVDPRVREAHG